MAAGAATTTTSDGGSVGGAKLRLLCSLGGRVLPRPSDGALRYAGGDTRLVSLPRNASFSLIISKLSDAYSLSTPFLLRYQLPDEDLDSLISVSTQEDLDNMMEEYDKILGPSPKLRVFLFPVSSDPMAEHVDPTDHDGLRYLEAVNGIRRKDSQASLASATVSSPNSTSSIDAASRSAHAASSAPLIDVDSTTSEQSSTFEPPMETKETQAKYKQPLSQLPPLPPAFLVNNNNNINNNINNGSDNNVFREDCNLCQKALPHAHSDTLVGDYSETRVNFALESLPVFHSLRPEDVARYIPAPIGNNFGFNQFILNSENLYPIHPPQYTAKLESTVQNPYFAGPVGSTEQTKPAGPTGSDPQMVRPGPIGPVEPVPTYSSFAPSHYQSFQIPSYTHLPQMVNGAYGYVDMGNYGIDPVYASTTIVNPNPSNEALSEELVIDDSRKVTHALPPRPKRVGSKESISPKEQCVNSGNLVNNTKLSELSAGFDESGLHSQSDVPVKETLFEPVRFGKGDEFVSQDLQCLEEGTLKCSELQSNNNFVDSETREPVALFNERSEPDNNKLEGENPSTEVAKGKQVGLINLGFPNTDDLGRLQIIKNSDLEELKELGSGTFGTVYHGKWRGSDVAIKRINDRCFVGKPSEQERMRLDFWNEASKLADLHHPNVVAFYGVVLDGPGGSIATVTEFMVNGSLRHALQRNDKTLDRRKRLIIAMDAAFGMEYLHSKNIVHFDLKSDNLLVNLRDPHRPICKVGDLGLSKVKCQTLISGGVRGTLPWMAPELLNGSSSLVSEKVDVFSFGIVLWELLTGEEPYADLHYGVIIGGIVSNTLRPQVPESCDPEWRSLMEQCWSSEPSDRPAFTEIVSRLRSMASSPQKGGPS